MNVPVDTCDDIVDVVVVEDEFAVVVGCCYYHDKMPFFVVLPMACWAWHIPVRSMIVL